jgi:hypothetical protein
MPGRRNTLRHAPWLIAALGAGCSFSAPPADDTRYKCGDPPVCPDGFVCTANECVPSGVLPDASGVPDAVIGDTPATIKIGARPEATLREGVTTDTYLTFDAATTTHGAEEQLTIDGSPAAVALLRFELSSMSTSATVVSATLTLNVFDVLTEGTVTAKALELQWDEAAATWNLASVGNSWPVAGAGGVAVGQTALNASAAFNATGDVVVDLVPAVVQTWISQPARNRGLRIEATGNQNLRVRSSEVADARQAPMLTVVYRISQ